MKYLNVIGTIKTLEECHIWPPAKIPGIERTRARLDAGMTLLRTKTLNSGAVPHMSVTVPDDALASKMDDQARAAEPQNTDANKNDKDSDPLIVLQLLAECGELPQYDDIVAEMEDLDRAASSDFSRILE